MNKPVDEFKNRFNYIITLRNIKPIELSEMTGISKSTISHYMSGYTKPKSGKLFLLAKALNVNEAWLMGYDIPMERNTVIENSQKILTPKDERDIEKKLTETLDQIVSGDGLMFSGEVMDEQTKKLLEISLRNTLESAKITAKKFTPKKYK